MVIESKVLDYIDCDETIFERESMDKLFKAGQPVAYKFDGYLQCIDTKREHEKIEVM